MTYHPRRYRHSLLPAVAAAFVLAALLVAAWAWSQPQQYATLGLALWSRGYTHCLYLTSIGRQRVLSPFNPNAVLGSDRYGDSIKAGVSAGNTVGERGSCLAIEEYVHRGFLPGFADPNYRCSDTDLQDATLVAMSTASAAYDDMVRALGHGPVCGDGACTYGEELTCPRDCGAVVTPTPTPPPTPTPTPVVTPCPSPTPPPCVPLVLPADVAATAHAAPSWTLRPWRRARLAALAAWIDALGGKCWETP